MQCFFITVETSRFVFSTRHLLKPGNQSVLQCCFITVETRRFVFQQVQETSHSCNAVLSQLRQADLFLQQGTKSNQETSQSCNAVLSQLRQADLFFNKSLTQPGNQSVQCCFITVETSRFVFQQVTYLNQETSQSNAVLSQLRQADCFQQVTISTSHYLKPVSPMLFYHSCDKLICFSTSH